MARPIRYLAIICHSLSELDVLLPIFADLKSRHSDAPVSFEVVIGVRKIYIAYQQSDFYRYCIKTLDIQLRGITLPNKFDHRQPIFFTKGGGRLLRLYHFLQAL